MTLTLKPLSEQVVVVVGASSGIGRESALQLAKRGAKVVVAARSEPGLQSLVQEITDQGGQATYARCDVADFAQVQAVAEAAVSAYGRIDTWVNCAATSIYASFEQTTPEEFRRITDVNYLGQVHGALAALPHLRSAGQGALIAISSVEAIVALPLHSAYSATKHAVEGAMDALRRELMSEKAPISVTSIKPGTINTPFFTNAANRMEVKPQGPPPVYQPSVVAQCVLYAAEHPVRDLYAGGSGKMMAVSQFLGPKGLDRTLAKTGIPSEQTSEPASPDFDGAVWGPTADQRAQGDFSGKARGFSVYTWLQTHPRGRAAVLGSLAGAPVVAAQLVRRRSASGSGAAGGGSTTGRLDEGERELGTIAVVDVPE